MARLTATGDPWLEWRMRLTYIAAGLVVFGTYAAWLWLTEVWFLYPTNDLMVVIWNYDQNTCKATLKNRRPYAMVCDVAGNIMPMKVEMMSGESVNIIVPHCDGQRVPPVTCHLPGASGDAR